MLNNSDLRHGLELDCTYQALLDRYVKPLIDFNPFKLYVQFIEMTLLY